MKVNGIINPDAAVEAVSLTCTNGLTNSSSFGDAPGDRRAWGRTVNLTAGQLFTAAAAVPATGDYDLYLYSAQPSWSGTPVILAASTHPGDGEAENLSYPANTNSSAVLVMKRVSGSGSFSLITDELPPSVIMLGPLVPANFTFSFVSIAGRTYVVQYKDLLSDSDWQVLQTISGDGTTKVITDPLASSQRFYRVAMK